jgi:hypothetical protein
MAAFLTTSLLWAQCGCPASVPVFVLQDGNCFTTSGWNFGGSSGYCETDTGDSCLNSTATACFFSLGFNVVPRSSAPSCCDGSAAFVQVGLGTVTYGGSVTKSVSPWIPWDFEAEPVMSVEYYGAAKTCGHWESFEVVEASLCNQDPVTLVSVTVSCRMCNLGV